MKKDKPQRTTIAEYNDQMMEDAYKLLSEAAAEMRRATRKVEIAFAEMISARADE